MPYQMELNGGWVHRLYLEDLLPLHNLGPTLSLLRLLVVPDAVVGLESLSEALLDFGGMADLENWLQANLGECAG